MSVDRRLKPTVVSGGTARPATPDLAIDLARFAASVNCARLGDDVIGAVKTNIVDTLSCALAGSSAQAIPEVSALVKEWGGATQADMFVFGGRVPAHHAAWVNSGMSHARDYDDTHDAAILHAGVSSVPAAIAAAQLRGKLSGAELIAAVAAGLEVTCRLGMAIKVDIVESGFIYSSLLGYFGATAAAGRALGLTLDEMVNAFGIVYSSVAGNHQVTRDASLMKRLQPGLAAQAAVVAVQLAKRGIRGAQDVFEGADGFFRVYLQDRVDPAMRARGPGHALRAAEPELQALPLLPRHACRGRRGTAGTRQGARPAGDIESIRVGVTAPGYQMVCVPEHVRLAPRTIVEAQFSIPYTVAAAWIDGKLGIGHFSDEALRRPTSSAGLTRTALRRRRDRPRLAALRDSRQGDRPVPRRSDLRERGWTTRRGTRRNPMTPRDFAAKTADCATFAARPLDGDTAVRLTSTVAELESMDDIATLVQIVTAAAEG